MAAPLAINPGATLSVRDLADGCRVAVIDDFLALLIRWQVYDVHEG